MSKYIWTNKLELGNIKNTDNKELIVVIGAGLAGCGAAKAAIESGKSVLMLEKESTPGGRVKSAYFNNHPVSLGAAWLEDYGPVRDALNQLEQDNKLKLIDPSNLEEIYTINNTIYSTAQLNIAKELYVDMIEYFKKNKNTYLNKTIQDLYIEFSEHLISNNNLSKEKVGHRLLLLEVLVLRINQHTNAKSINKSKCYELLHIDGSAVCEPLQLDKSGYESLRYIQGDVAHLIEYLIINLLESGELKLLLDSEVIELDAKTGVVKYKNSSNNIKYINAAYIINTMPIPVLQSINPEVIIKNLSKDQYAAIDKIETGIAKKIFVSFNMDSSNKELNIPQVFKNNIFIKNLQSISLIEIVKIDPIGSDGYVCKMLLTGDDSLYIDKYTNDELKVIIAKIFAMVPGIEEDKIKNAIDLITINNQVDGIWPVTPNSYNEQYIETLLEPVGKHIFAQDFIADTNSMNGAYNNGYQQCKKIIN